MCVYVCGARRCVRVCSSESPGRWQTEGRQWLQNAAESEATARVHGKSGNALRCRSRPTKARRIDASKTPKARAHKGPHSRMRQVAAGCSAHLQKKGRRAKQEHFCRHGADGARSGRVAAENRTQKDPGTVAQQPWTLALPREQDGHPGSVLVKRVKPF